MTVRRLRRRLALACACLVLATSALTLISATSVTRAGGTHHDGRADYSVFYDQGGRIARIAVDGNRDGRADFVATFDPVLATPVRTEVDVDFDGSVDELVLYRDGRLVKVVDGSLAGRTPSIREVQRDLQEIAQFIVPGSSVGDGNSADTPPPVIGALRPQRAVAAASRTVESDHPRGPPATRLS